MLPNMVEQSQGTEYTLQGVMRFLQIEWHNHERARNAWDIERAEMKAKIAKQEGDCRSAKKLNELLDRQIRMLERALKAERAKNEVTAAGEDPPTEEEVRREWNGGIGMRLNFNKGPKKQQANGGPEEQEPPQSDKEAQRDKSRLFLQKCVEELTYLLTPPAHPLPPQPNPQSLQHSTGYGNQQDLPPNMQEVYLHQPHQQQQQQIHQQHPHKRVTHAALSHLPSLPNHHPPPIRTAPDFNSNSSHHLQQAALVSRQNLHHQPPPQTPSQGPPHPSRGGSTQHTQSPFLTNPEEHVEKVTHSYDAYGRPVPSREEDSNLSRPLIADDTDEWNFDDTSTLEDTSQEITPTRRPDTDVFPSANHAPEMSPSRTGSGSYRRRSFGSKAMVRRRSDGAHDARESAEKKADAVNFKVRFALRGHLDVVRSIIFTGGGSPSEPEICTTGDDGTIKRWIIPASYSNYSGNKQAEQQYNHHPDLDIQSYFTHRGHEGMVTSLAACPASASFSTGGRAVGDGWVFSGGQDSTIRVWERGRVDPKATLDGHTDAIWTVCVLPASSATVFGQDNNNSTNPTGGGDRILLASGSADRSVKIWAVSAPPQLSSPQSAPGGSRRGVGGSRRHSVTSGSNFPSSPQPSTASATPFLYTLIHSIEWPRGAAASPTSIFPLGTLGESFVVSYSDSSVLIFDTRTGEEVVGMASGETYDGTPDTGVNTVVVVNSTSVHGTGEAGGTMSLSLDSGRGVSEDESVGIHGATGSSKEGGVEGTVISGHEDRFVRFFDANSGQCSYSMLAHPSAIACLSLSPDGRELVSAGHDASLRFWSLEKRSCIQEITNHRLMRGEGVVSVVWSQDGRWVVSGGGDGVVKVFSR